MTPRRDTPPSVRSLSPRSIASDKNTLITPIEALEDSRDVVRWMRRNASELVIDPNYIAAYGISAGGHLAASLAFFCSTDKNQIGAVPNAILLISPAVAMGKDEYFQGLLGKRALATEYSPEEQMDKPRHQRSSLTGLSTI